MLTGVQAIKLMDWEDVFGNSSQTENMYDYLIDDISFDEFVDGFYPDCDNKKVAEQLDSKGLERSVFRLHARQIFNIARVGQFRRGDEMTGIQKYVSKL